MFCNKVYVVHFVTKQSWRIEWIRLSFQKLPALGFVLGNNLCCPFHYKSIRSIEGIRLSFKNYQLWDFLYLYIYALGRSDSAWHKSISIPRMWRQITNRDTGSPKLEIWMCLSPRKQRTKFWTDVLGQNKVQFVFYLTTWESLIGHSRWALPHYTEMGHSSSSFWGTASPGRGSNPRPPVPMALNIPEGHRGIGSQNKLGFTLHFFFNYPPLKT